jgi:hypothetical protein
MEKDIKRASGKSLASVAESEKTNTHGFTSYEAEVDFNRRTAVYLADLRAASQYGGRQ